MKKDPLRIEFRKIGGAFQDGPAGSSVVDIFAVVMAHCEQPQEFIISTGTAKEAINDAIMRFDTIITNLNQLKFTLP